jgi:hypothetical protein
MLSSVMATTSSPSPQLWWLFAAGGGTTLFGVILRLSARALAWPDSYSYSGDRGNTNWAFMEAAYVDISLFAIGFGLAAVLIAVCCFYRNSATRPLP